MKGEGVDDDGVEVEDNGGVKVETRERGWVVRGREVDDYSLPSHSGLRGHTGPV